MPSNVNLNNLHHAYLIEGDESVFSGLRSLLEEIGVKINGNPDVIFQTYGNFGINDSRFLRSFQAEKSMAGQGKFLAIYANTFLPEAQNALLKTFEEPTEGTHFFLVTPRPELLLETLRSRLETLELAPIKSIDPATEKKAKEFLEETVKGRLQIVTTLIKAHKDEKDILKMEALNLLNALESLLYESKKSVGGFENEDDFIFGEIRKCRGYLFDSGAAAKMLLEHIAIVLPEK